MVLIAILTVVFIIWHGESVLSKTESNGLLEYCLSAHEELTKGNPVILFFKRCFYFGCRNDGGGIKVFIAFVVVLIISFAGGKYSTSVNTQEIKYYEATLTGRSRSTPAVYFIKADGTPSLKSYVTFDFTEDSDKATLETRRSGLYNINDFTKVMFWPFKGMNSYILHVSEEEFSKHNSVLGGADGKY